MKYQVVIIGGGCAGATTGITLMENGIKNVAIIEKSDFSKPRVGETIQPPTMALLQSIGVDHEKLRPDHLESGGSCSAWGNNQLSYRDFLFKGLGNGWHLNRNEFDKMMLKRAGNSGAQIHQNTTLKSSCYTRDGWELICQNGEGEIELTANFVVDATGRSAWFARQQGANKILFDDLHAVYTYWQPFEKQSSSLHTLIESCEIGWWYSALLPDGKLVLGLMTDKEMIKEKGLADFTSYNELLGKTIHTKKRASGYSSQQNCSIHVASTHLLHPLVTKNWLAVGDSASTYDPLSSYGIHKGIQNGMDAAKAIGEMLGGNPNPLSEYEQSVKSNFENYLQIHSIYYNMETRWANSRFWQNRQQSIQTHPMSELASDHLLRNGPHNQYLPTEELKIITKICQYPIKAHSLVRKFQEVTGKQFPDWQVIKAIDHLHRKGAIKLTAFV